MYCAILLNKTVLNKPGLYSSRWGKCSCPPRESLPPCMHSSQGQPGRFPVPHPWEGGWYHSGLSTTMGEVGNSQTGRDSPFLLLDLSPTSKQNNSSLNPEGRGREESSHHIFRSPEFFLPLAKKFLTVERDVECFCFAHGDILFSITCVKNAWLREG